MTFQQSIEKCLKNYANFNGRAKRSELWFFYLFVILVGMATGIIDFIIDPTGNFVLFNTIASLALLIPQFSAGSRRLHDIGKSGWWQLLYLTIIGGIVVLAWLATDTSKKNQFGPVPKNNLIVFIIFNCFFSFIILLYVVKSDRFPNRRKR